MKTVQRQGRLIYKLVSRSMATHRLGIKPEQPPQNFLIFVCTYLQHMYIFCQNETSSQYVRKISVYNVLQTNWWLTTILFCTTVFLLFAEYFIWHVRLVLYRITLKNEMYAAGLLSCSEDKWASELELIMHICSERDMKSSEVAQQQLTFMLDFY